MHSLKCIVKCSAAVGSNCDLASRTAGTINTSLIVTKLTQHARISDPFPAATCYNFTIREGSKKGFLHAKRHTFSIHSPSPPTPQRRKQLDSKRHSFSIFSPSPTTQPVRPAAGPSYTSCTSFQRKELAAAKSSSMSSSSSSSGIIRGLKLAAEGRGVCKEGAMVGCWCVIKMHATCRARAGLMHMHHRSPNQSPNRLLQTHCCPR